LFRRAAKILALTVAALAGLVIAFYAFLVIGSRHAVEYYYGR
jgi:hypothetical protein